MSADPNKKIVNPLFNPNVTGSTYEDFAQHAVLLPAQVPTPPVQNVSTVAEVGVSNFNNNFDVPQEHTTYQPQINQNLAFQQPLQDIQNIPFSQQPLEDYTTNISPPHWGAQPSEYRQNLDDRNNYQSGPDLQGGPSHISSLISSFSNIWKRGPDTNSSPPLFQGQQPITPTPAVVETYFEPKANAPPVPLFSPVDANLNPLFNKPTPPITQAGPTNTYRRSGSKRPTYAKIPGLSKTDTNQQQQSNYSQQPHSSRLPIPLPQLLASPNYFQPELSGYSSVVSDSQISSIQTVSRSPTPTLSGTRVATSFDQLDPLRSEIFSPEVKTEASLPQTAYAKTNTFQHLASSPFLDPISTSPFLNPVSSSPFLTPVQDLNTSSVSRPVGLIAAQPTGPIMTTMPVTDVANLSGPSNQPYPTSYSQTDGIPQINPQMASTTIYRPVYHHWFYKKDLEGRGIWKPFSMIDSLELEKAFTSPDLSPDKVVATDGGRFDVNILRRQRNSVYWKSESTEVRRCSWFHKGNTEGKYVPYEENIATKLEEEYKLAFEANRWHRKVELTNGESVMLHGPDVMALFPPTQSPDAWGNAPQIQTRPRLVKRGMDEFDIDEGECANIDHLLFMVHGIGSVCDLKFRPVEEVVDEFRIISTQLIQSHYRSSCERGIANRVEVLPISWHDELHSDDTGIDKKLKSITLESIPKLRDFTNNTLLDILFYTSPFYCQKIISTVGNELNRILDLFKERNPNFNGGVSLAGHSLGSLILFDILCHQHPEPEKEEAADCTDEDVVPPLKECKPHPQDRKMSRRISYMMGTAGTGQPQLTYPHLSFQPLNFFALGSPIGMFVTVRGLNTLGEQFALPTCPGFFNIFHPYDPVAYRIESLVNPQLSSLKPVLIPHHKGRKRMHLELKETMSRVGTDLKHKVIDTMKNTWNSLFQLGFFGNKPQDSSSLEAEVSKVLEEEFAKEQSKETETEEQVEVEPTDLCLGALNKGSRIDFVLQEAPFEFFNEYIFALTSHVCYWESEDTILLILKEIYNCMKVQTDCQIPQQTMTIERPPPSPKSARTADKPTSSNRFGMDPTVPIAINSTLGPPPVTGFVRKS